MYTINAHNRIFYKTFLNLLEPATSWSDRSCGEKTEL
jgi:hypothetical protein